jgi:hypothetical protein
MMHRTGEEFKDGETAISIAESIKADLESKGFQVKSETKAFSSQAKAPHSIRLQG